MFPSAKRRNGFSAPLSSDQLKVFLLYPCNLAGYYLLVTFMKFYDEPVRNGLLFLNVALTLVILSAWLAAELVDPEHTPGKAGIPVVCYPPPEKSSRYCGGCRKTVLGLDHHCSWLNTCIGRRNYVPFVVLVFTGAAQQGLPFPPFGRWDVLCPSPFTRFFPHIVRIPLCLAVVHLAVGVVAIAVWQQQDPTRTAAAFNGSIWGFYLVVSVFLLLSAVMATGLLLLAGFHSYLMLVVRKGTYDWLLSRRGGRLYETGGSVGSYHSYSEVQCRVRNGRLFAVDAPQ
jgi:hypothetical protein